MRTGTFFYNTLGKKVDKGKGSAIFSRTIARFKKVRGKAFKKYHPRKKDIGKQFNLRIFDLEMGALNFLGFGSPALAESNFKKNLAKHRVTSISKNYLIFERTDKDPLIVVAEQNLCSIQPM